MLFSERVKIAWSLFCKVKLLFNVSCECSIFALLDNSFCKLFISSMLCLCSDGENSSGIFVKEFQFKTPVIFPQDIFALLPPDLLNQVVIKQIYLVEI